MPLARLAARLSRETSGGTHIPEIDGLRFVAIAGVFLYHLNGYLVTKGGEPVLALARRSSLDEILNHGHLGVPLFFGISGFVLALPFVRYWLADAPPVRLRAYYLRRLTRIEPPFLINLVIVGTLLLLVNQQSPADVVSHWLPSAVYAHSLAYPGELTHINPVAWSLEIEVQFYLLAPALALLFALRRRAMRCGAIVLAAALATAGVHVAHTPWLLSYVQLFLAGFLAAEWYATRPADARRTWRYDALGVAATGLVWLTAADGRYLEAVLPVGIAALLIAALGGVACGRMLRSRWVVVIGGMCYTLYLYHFYAISLFGRLAPQLGIQGGYTGLVAAQLALVGIPTLIGCAAMFLLTEKPFMRRQWPAELSAFVRGRTRVTAAVPEAVGRG